MAYKGSQHSGTPVTHRQVSNSKGFSRLGLGHDTRPGPDGGAPLKNTKRVDDGTVKRGRYVSGNPYNLHTGGEPGHVLGSLGKEAPGHDTPVEGHGQQPNKHATSKAAEVRSIDPRAGLGARPRGTVGG